MGDSFWVVCSQGLNMDVRAAESGGPQACCSCLPMTTGRVWSASLDFSAGCAWTSKIDSKGALDVDVVI